MLQLAGLHHISSMVKHPQENIDFYTNVLGLRLVKQTLNYDDKEGFHFYFSDGEGQSPLSTFFPMSDIQEGEINDGQVGFYRYAVPTGTLDFWRARLESYGVFHYTYHRFGEEIIAFADPHGLELELVESDKGQVNEWTFNGVTPETGIKGIAAIILFSKRPASTSKLFQDIFGFTIIDEDEEFIALTLDDALGSELYIRKQTVQRGKPGSGTVHHVAYAVENDEIADWITLLTEAGYAPTEVKDRFYFQSIYFREHGGILIELATVGPGIFQDESLEKLGTELIIPGHYSQDAEDLKAEAMPLFIQELSELQTYSYRNRAEYKLVTERAKLLAEINAYAAQDKARGLEASEKITLAALRAEFMNLK